MTRLSAVPARVAADRRSAIPAASGWLAWCREGFEAECRTELAAAIAARASAPDLAATTVPGLVRLECVEAPAPWPVVPVAGLVFARQTARVVAECVTLTDRDRIGPLVAMACASGLRVGAVRVEYPDSDAGKRLSGLCRRLAPLLAAGLTDAGILGGAPGAPMLHVVFTEPRRALLAVSLPEEAGPWHNGIPRLRMPGPAPSRSTLKLAEAFEVMLTADERARWLCPGMRAVDLGAAPGGWTWQLIARGIGVTAVDNGPLKGDLVDNALVRHLREDGFRFRPRAPVDWLTCDMIASPARVAALVADWIANGHAQRAMFNLKLPMKRRSAEIERLRGLFVERLSGAGHGFDLRLKHLYHDREEVTGFCTAAGRTAARKAGRDDRMPARGGGGRRQRNGREVRQ